MGCIFSRNEALSFRKRRKVSKVQINLNFSQNSWKSSDFLRLLVETAFSKKKTVRLYDVNAHAIPIWNLTFARGLRPNYQFAGNLVTKINSIPTVTPACNLLNIENKIYVHWITKNSMHFDHTEYINIYFWPAGRSEQLYSEKLWLVTTSTFVSATFSSTCWFACRLQINIRKKSNERTSEWLTRKRKMY